MQSGATKRVVRSKDIKQVKKDQFDRKKDKDSKIDKDKRIPESEWKLISQAASSSMGCALAEKCPFKHHCMVCGAAPPMVGNH